MEERSSILSEWADFIDDEDKVASEDNYEELRRWRYVPVSKQDRNLLRDVENDTSIFVYWNRHRLSYPQLSKLLPVFSPFLRRSVIVSDVSAARAFRCLRRVPG
jgi:hypothetical protein